MLVLSRKENQSVVFPNLGISVSVVSVKGKRVRLGIDAPSDIPILRGELRDGANNASSHHPLDRHAIRNRLNTVALSLHVIAQSSVLDPHQSDEAIKRALSELEVLNDELGDIGSRGKKLTSKTQRTEARESIRTALVVEDNDHERSLLSAYLRMRGYSVVEASNGLEAIRLLEQATLPDVVLLDMNMPRLNGAKTVSRIRMSPQLRDIRVFGLSGTDRTEWKIPLGDRGVDGWFLKPVNPESIIEQIDELACV